MKKTTKAKLALNRTTLKTIDKGPLETVVGGIGPDGGAGGGDEAAAFSRQGTCWSCNSCIACA